MAACIAALANLCAPANTKATRAKWCLVQPHSIELPTHLPIQLVNVAPPYEHGTRNLHTVVDIGGHSVTSSGSTLSPFSWQLHIHHDDHSWLSTVFSTLMPRSIDWLAEDVKA